MMPRQPEEATPEAIEHVKAGLVASGYVGFTPGQVIITDLSLYAPTERADS